MWTAQCSAAGDMNSYIIAATLYKSRPTSLPSVSLPFYARTHLRQRPTEREIAQAVPGPSIRPSIHPSVFASHRESKPMGFVSFVGRVLFASVFLLSAYQEFNEFGTDGGPAAKALKPKFIVFTQHISSLTGVAVPPIDMKHVIMATIALKGLGGLLFILSSSFGAWLLGAYLAFITPVVYDFYNYDMETSDFVKTFMKFIQNLALLGALLFFLGMKNSIPKRTAKKKGPKSKTN